MTPFPGFMGNNAFEAKLSEKKGKNDPQIRVNGHWVRNWEVFT